MLGSQQTGGSSQQRDIDRIRVHLRAHSRQQPTRWRRLVRRQRRICARPVVARTSPPISADHLLQCRRRRHLRRSSSRTRGRCGRLRDRKFRTLGENGGCSGSSNSRSNNNSKNNREQQQLLIANRNRLQQLRRRRDCIFPTTDGPISHRLVTQPVRSPRITAQHPPNSTTGRTVPLQRQLFRRFARLFARHGEITSPLLREDASISTRASVSRCRRR